jgi:hypothetical protein
MVGLTFRSRFDKSTAQAVEMTKGRSGFSNRSQVVDILNTARDTICSPKLLEVKRMATPAADKFIQIATSSVIAADRLYTTVHALDEKGNVWEYKPDETTSSKGKWIRLSNDRQ